MKVLIAEDDMISLRSLQKSLFEWKYDVTIAKDGEEAWKILQKEDIRLAILDWVMPKLDGIELCRMIREWGLKKDSKYVYVILLTGRDEQEDIIQGLSAGADDYITKPYDFLELKIRLQNGKRIIELEDTRIHLANIDGLTQLWNKNKILDFFNEEVHRSQRTQNPVGIIMSDVDHFKDINDTYGHQIGDNVLNEIARRLKSSIRLYDKIGRYGGDEFLIVLPECGKKDMEKIAERLRTSVSERKFYTDKDSFQATISLGATTTEMTPGANSDDLIKASDKALYKAKEMGRNKYITIFDLENNENKS